MPKVAPKGAGKQPVTDVDEEAGFDGLGDETGHVHLPPVSALEADAEEASKSCCGRIKASLMYNPRELAAGRAAMKARHDVEVHAQELAQGKKSSTAWANTLDAMTKPDHTLDDFLDAEPTTWRGKLSKFMESDSVSLLVLVLIILDVVAVFGEILLTNVCFQEGRVIAWEHGLHDFSLSILFILIVQQLILIVAEGPTTYCGNFWYVVDFIVVTASISLDLIIKHPEGGLVVLLMSWRIVRVVHGFVTTVEMQKHQVKHFRHEVENMEKRIAVLTTWRIVLLRSRRLHNRAALIQNVVKKWKAYHRKRTEDGGAGALASGAAAAGAESKELNGSVGVTVRPGRTVG
mmetsp:Transcript_22070/g.77369  ORF Transcript_22070/g.77369 Transcript_22070/m.77369 type:complete len:347 (-) Transcript_22070:127-1167(-)